MIKVAETVPPRQSNEEHRSLLRLSLNKMIVTIKLNFCLSGWLAYLVMTNVGNLMTQQKQTLRDLSFGLKGFL